jgi:hypothetical protein
MKVTTPLIGFTITKIEIKAYVRKARSSILDLR